MNRGRGVPISHAADRSHRTVTAAARSAAIAVLAGLLLWTVGLRLGTDLAGAAPVHPFLEAASLDGSGTPGGEFEKACGVTVDVNGYVYVSNSGDSAVDVFDPVGNYLTAIGDADGPCGVAVDSKGNVYVVDTTTKNVVMYSPVGGVFPPTAGLAYTPAQTIDSSGQARAVAVNPANDRLFVNQGTQIVERKSTTEGSGILNGEIGKGTLVEGFGVDVYRANGNVYASDNTGGRIYVFNSAGTKVRATIDGSGSPGGSFGSLPLANIAVDQSNGHVFVSDVKEGGVVTEFEASGSYLSQIAHSFQDAGPSDVAVDPSEGATRGRVYVTSGAGVGSQVYVFGPLPVPSHPALPGLSPSKEFNNPCGVAVDSHGDVYVSSEGTSSIDIFTPDGSSLKYLTTISDSGRPCGVAVDSAGNVFVSHPNAQKASDQTVLEYQRSGPFPPTAATSYAAPKVIDGVGGATGVAVNPANQHVLVAHREVIFEYDSAEHGAGLLKNNLGAGLGMDEISGVGVYGKSGNLYAISQAFATRGVVVFDPVANERLVVINGSNPESKKPNGGFTLGRGSIAVDQSNGHVYFNPKGEATDVYEFEASGAYVSRFGRSTTNGGFPGLAVDNSGLANNGDVFVAGGLAPGPPTVDAYGPTTYGEPPVAVTGLAEASETEATLNGTVDPRGFALQACGFEYVDDASFGVGGFTGATMQACAETPAQIGSGTGPVPVHADITGLSTGRYHFRLMAQNSFGVVRGDAGVFGPPLVTTKPASPVLFTEATLRALVDPDGLPTTYHFEYGADETYGHSTPVTTIPAGAGPVEVSAHLFGLSPQSTYHFQIVVSNSVSTFVGPDQTLTTPARPPSPSCPNAQLRTGASARLPDCRAYELVTPDLNGLKPQALVGTAGETSSFDTWFGAPHGDSVIFDTNGSQPGADGNGVYDQYQAVRGAGGWTSRLVAPSGAEAESPLPGGISPDHGYAFWRVNRTGHMGGSLESGTADTTYLRNPDGSYVPLGLGSLGEDPNATGRWIGPGGSHVVFTTPGGSAVKLEPGAPAAGIAAIYDRTPDGETHVVSLLPGDAIPTASSKYLGVSADGSAVFFELEGKMYERLDNAETVEVAPTGSTFGGASEDGARSFYLRGGNIFAFEAATAQTSQLTGGGGATIVNVSADGSHLYFVSPQQLDGAKGSAGSNNLYVWDGVTTRFIAILSTDDMEDPESATGATLAGWTRAIGPDPGAFIGPAFDPSRTTPDGSVFVFQSYANLTAYDSEGRSEIYRYDTADQSLVCVSCIPSGEPPAGNAELQQVNEGLDPQQNPVGISPVNAISHIPNVTADGEAVFFQTIDSLVSGDGDQTTDVYEWRGGQVFLISSGQSTTHNYLYGMSVDGRDVFFETNDSLVPQDEDGGSPSIYDARVGGGFLLSTAQPCREDVCQGPPAPPPSLGVPGSSSVQGAGNVTPPKHHKKKRRHRKKKHKHHSGHKHQKRHDQRGGVR